MLLALYVSNLAEKKHLRKNLLGSKRKCGPIKYGYKLINYTNNIYDFF